jgi:16S rRNA (cytosine967-C5)-methyltransferase
MIGELMSARDAAYEVLCRWNERSEMAAGNLEEQVAARGLPPGERPLAMELVYGVIRRRETLAALMAPLVSRPLEKVETGARVLLELGIYQLVFLSGTPDYAVVNETVETARRLGRPQWTGFLNGVLRAAARGLKDEVVATRSADSVPLAEGGYRRLPARVFPDPGLDFSGYFSRAFSFPTWMVERWRRRFSERELESLGFWFNRPPRLSLRVNTLCQSRDALLEILSAAGIAAVAGAHPQALRLEQSARVTDLPGFREGWFAVQDESAMWAATLLAPKPGDRVLDLCAAPGGKTAHLAAIMNNQGSLIAADVDPRRLARVDENVARLGLSIVRTRLVRRDTSDLPEGPFDAVLLDVPCSNTGVLGKRPEARWRLTAADLVELTVLQRQLVDAACTVLRPGGRLVYSTCSIEPEENELLIAAVLRDNSRLRLLEERFHVPGAPSDGGYLALMETVA